MERFLLLWRVSVVVLVVALLGLGAAGAAPGAAAKPAKCAAFAGTVLLTYSHPDTIILHIIRGKVNAPTTFTMTPQTLYQRNGQPAAFDDIQIGDVGTLTATEQLPSGTLLTCTVDVTGP
jgi:hypothetical protein